MADEILVSLQYESRADWPGHVPGLSTAAVYRSDGEVLMTDDVAEGGGAILEGHAPVALRLSDELSVEGGLAPRSAVAAEVIAPTGARQKAAVTNSAWLMLVEHPAARTPMEAVAQASGDAMRADLWAL